MSGQRGEPDLDIWLMRADGSEAIRLTENQGADRCVAWSPNLIPTLVSKILPDRLDRLFYGEQYFGSERFPDWHGGGASARPEVDTRVA